MIELMNLSLGGVYQHIGSLSSGVSYFHLAILFSELAFQSIFKSREGLAVSKKLLIHVE